MRIQCTAGVTWVSGAIYSESEKAALTHARQAEEAEVEARRAELRADKSKPLVYLDVEIRGEAVGRMVCTDCCVTSRCRLAAHPTQPRMSTGWYESPRFILRILQVAMTAMRRRSTPWNLLPVVQAHG